MLKFSRWSWFLFPSHHCKIIMNLACLPFTSTYVSQTSSKMTKEMLGILVRVLCSYTLFQAQMVLEESSQPFTLPPDSWEHWPSRWWPAVYLTGLFWAWDVIPFMHFSVSRTGCDHISDTAPWRPVTFVSVSLFNFTFQGERLALCM